MSASFSVIEQFKNVFLSPVNTEFLMQSIIKKASKIPAVGDKEITIDRPGLEQLQLFIFDTNFVDITEELNSNEPLLSKLQKTLKSLNKITLSHMTNLIHQQLTENHHQQPSLQSHGTQNTNMQTQLPSQDQGISSPPPPPSPPTPPPEYTQIEHIHLFSADAFLKDGTYHFNFPISCVKSITSFKFNSLRNWFNVTEFNNKIILVENETKPTNATLPIGFYSTTDLTSQLTKTLNEASTNKLKYTVEIIPQTGKTKISCYTRDGIPVMFNLSFGEKHFQFNNFGLNELLGFKKTDYCNNNYYISEERNITNNSYDNVYIKLFINGTSVQKIKSSGFTGFSYFADSSNECEEEFVFQDQLDIQSVSFQLCNTRDYIITMPITFDVLLSFEVLQHL